MKLLIFGASGATGFHLVQQALLDGHLVTAFVRNANRLKHTHSNLSVIEGDVKDLEKVQRAVVGQDAVFSALGADSIFRFDPVVVDGLANIVTAMDAQQVPRLIYLSTIGVAATRSGAGFMIRALAPTILRNEIKGHEMREKIILSSPLKWTIIRAPILTNDAMTGKYRTGEHLVSTQFATKLSRADVAQCMLSNLENNESVRKAISLMA